MQPSKVRDTWPGVVAGDDVDHDHDHDDHHHHDFDNKNNLREKM